MEKDTSEELCNTTTKGSEKGEKFDDVDLDMTMEEYLRKMKAKSPVIQQIYPTQQSPTKSPTPMITTPQSTPPSTGTTPPPPKQADVIQKETEAEKLPTKEPTPPLEQPKQKTPPIQEETPIGTPNITVESSVLQVNDDAPKEAMPEEAMTVETPSNTTVSSSAPEKEPTVVATVVEGNTRESLNVVVAELAEKMREELGKKFLSTEAGKSTQKKRGGEAVKVVVSMEEPKDTVAATRGDPKEKEADKESTEEIDPTLKDDAETLKELPEKVLEETAEMSKEAEIQSGAIAPGATALDDTTPKPDKSTKTAALKTGATASQSGGKGGRRQPKPKPTPTRLSNTLRKGAKPH